MLRCAFSAALRRPLVKSTTLPVALRRRPLHPSPRLDAATRSVTSSSSSTLPTAATSQWNNHHQGSSSSFAPATLAAASALVATTVVGTSNDSVAFTESRLIASSALATDNALAINDAIGTDIKALAKALAQRQERQKVGSGRLLHEMHELAKETTKAAIEARDGQEAQEEDTTTVGHLQRLSSTDKRKDPEAAEQPSVHHHHTPAAPVDSLIQLPANLSKLTPHQAWRIINLLKQGTASLSREDIKRIAFAAQDLLLTEPTLVDLSQRADLEQVTVVGDLHGQFGSLFSVLTLLGDKSKSSTASPWDGTGAVVFNGDFVDRGDNSLEVMMSLLLLKLAYPKHVYLNRGNHEDAILSTVYGYMEELVERFGDPVDEIWDSITNVFCALPLCVKTKHAAIMHGGIPYEGFLLEDLAAITAEERSAVTSTLEPGDDMICQLIQNVLWSDPTPTPGMDLNHDRGAGMMFGPDVAHDFLQSNGLQYLVRSHEPVDEGYQHLECSETSSTVTVFSANNYPNGDGYNWGAVVVLDNRPDCEPSCSPIQFEDAQQHVDPLQDEQFSQKTFAALAEVIREHRGALATEFDEMARRLARRKDLSKSSKLPLTKEETAKVNKFTKKRTTRRSKQKQQKQQKPKGPRFITREQWADVMSYVLKLHGIDWLSLQPYLAPTMLLEEEKTKNALQRSRGSGGKIMATSSAMVSSSSRGSSKALEDTGLIDYHLFLELHTNAISGNECCQALDPKTLDVLLQNHSMLLTVFKFLDTDKNGTIDRDEFRAGMQLLRKKFPQNAMQDTDAIFDAIDLDGNGTIELQEFETAFQVAEMPSAVAVFKIFDTDRSGTIDRGEFQQGVHLLNQRLPPAEQIHNPDALFDQLDQNGNGEIELEELKTVLEKVLPGM